MNYKPYKHLPPFKGMVLQNFPFIEEDFDAITNYQLLCKIVEYLRNVIANELTMEENVTNLYNEFVSLKNYIDNYFANLDVQEEINNKLDEMASDGSLTNLIKDYVDPIYQEYENNINDAINTQNGKIEIIENQVNSLASGAPIPVSSTSDMTDTDKIYVNTTDGYWYYYDGTNWTQGGVYQSTQTASNSIEPFALKNINSYNLKDVFHFGLMNNYDINGAGFNPQKEWVNNNTLKSIKTRIPYNSFIKISKTNSSNRFRIALVNSPLSAGDTVSSFLVDDNSLNEYIFYNTTYNYLYCTYTSNSETNTINVEVINENTINNYIYLNNLKFLDYEIVDNLYDVRNKISGVGTGISSADYRYSKDSNYCTYKFLLNPNETYNITKTGGNKFRVCLWYWNPTPTTYNEIQQNPYLSYLSHPSYIVIDDDEENTCTFNSGNYLCCTILFDNTKDMSASFNITSTSNKKYKIPNELIDIFVNNPMVIKNKVDSSNDIWTMWNSRLAFGMNTNTAPVPTSNEQQFLNKGTIITYNTGSKDYNRWGYHVFEAYDKDLYNRITMLVDKHLNEIGKKVAEFYYYTGASHAASSYAWFRLGSDVKEHSFMFDRDTFVAYGASDLRNVMTLARISPTNDLITTYDTVAEVDSHYDPENNATNNAKGLLYVALKNAQNGSMFYDTDRNKIVVKVNNEWCDMNVTPIASDTYDF